MLNVTSGLLAEYVRLCSHFNGQGCQTYGSRARSGLSIVLIWSVSNWCKEGEAGNCLEFEQAHIGKFV